MDFVFHWVKIEPHSTIVPTYPRGIRSAVTSEFHRAGRAGWGAKTNSPRKGTDKHGKRNIIKSIFSFPLQAV
jgi:hypothetical protein